MSAQMRCSIIARLPAIVTLVFLCPIRLASRLLHSLKAEAFCTRHSNVAAASNRKHGSRASPAAETCPEAPTVPNK